MINKCKHLKIRTKKGIKYGYCSLYKKEVNIYCSCPDKEYKAVKPIKKVSNTRSKREKHRFSIIYTDLTKCCVCGLKQGIEINEVFEGRNRNNSMIYGMCCPFCKTHHDKFHNDIEFNHIYKVMFQKEFELTHTREEFIEIFKRNYIQ